MSGVLGMPGPRCGVEPACRAYDGDRVLRTRVLRTAAGRSGWEVVAMAMRTHEQEGVCRVRECAPMRRASMVSAASGNAARPELPGIRVPATGNDMLPGCAIASFLVIVTDDATGPGR
ncbi:hypothetical protein GCM10027290_54490 [Micromonospora sonneratiae]|uniref:Uncharacterized protein n=1 Tax=Micromonospora sonneratiae TaxID=1184706 RepID=A0ABW3YGG7_9ACTN